MYAGVFFRNSVLFSLLLIFKATTNSCTCAPVDTNADAKTIVDSKFDPKVIASILPYRTPKECADINKAIAPLNGGKPLVDPKYTPLVDKKSENDLIFALVNDPLTVSSMYLGHYLDLKDQDYITMIFIQTAERMKFKQVYDTQHNTTFDDACNKQKEPFLSALKVWIEADRVDKSIYDNGEDDSCDQGRWLTSEKDKWNDGPSGRTGLDGMLMKHTIKYAESGLDCYTFYSKFIEDDIKQRINDKDLVKLYASLARYIEDENDYLARILHDHCDDKDNFALWIIVLTNRRSAEAIKAIDLSFQKAYGIDGATLKDYILQSKVQNNMIKDMLAALIDPTHKPI